MKHYCMELCLQMQQELAGRNNLDTCFQKNIECCFAIANKYWNGVKEKLETYCFKKGDEEIQFFNNLKPKFTSQIEYYGLILEAPIKLTTSGRGKLTTCFVGEDSVVQVYQC